MATPPMTPTRNLTSTSSLAGRCSRHGRRGTARGQVGKKQLGNPVVPQPGFTYDLRVERAIDTWGDISANRQHRRVPVGLDTYAEMDFVSTSFVKSLNLRPCTKPKHNHSIPFRSEEHTSELQSPCNL